jgi:hypothetical protein
LNLQLGEFNSSRGSIMNDPHEQKQQQNDYKKLIKDKNWGKLFPEERRWLLLLDKAVHIKNDPYYFDTRDVDGNQAKGELGYLAAMKQGFDYLLSILDEDITPASLIELHKRVRINQNKDVMWNPYAPPECLPTYILSGFCGQGVYPPANGLPFTPSKELQQEWREEGLLYDPCDEENNVLRVDDIYKRFLGVFISTKAPEAVSPLSEADLIGVAEKLQQYTPTRTWSIKEGLSNYKEKLRENIDRYIQSRTTLVISFSGLPIGLRPQHKELSDLSDVCTEHKLPVVLHTYEQYKGAIERAQTEDEKLLAIARFIRRLSITHPFIDYNQRTLVFLQLNQCLMQQGFPPCIYPSPYDFDGLVLARDLVERIKLGCEDFLKQMFQAPAVAAVPETPSIAKNPNQIWRSKESAKTTNTTQPKNTGCNLL